MVLLLVAVGFVTVLLSVSVGLLGTGPFGAAGVGAAFGVDPVVLVVVIV